VLNSGIRSFFFLILIFFIRANCDQVRVIIFLN
jgi:hypothetical protein